MRCPSCGTDDPQVYHGFTAVECPNPRCIHAVEPVTQPRMVVRDAGPGTSWTTVLSMTLQAQVPLNKPPAMTPAPPPPPAPAAAWVPKVGDPVRTNAKWAPPKVGIPGVVVYTIPVPRWEVEMTTARGGNYYGFADEFEPWEPRVSERVRYRRSSGIGNIGEVVAGSDSAGWDVRWANGLCGLYGTAELFPEV